MDAEQNIPGWCFSGGSFRAGNNLVKWKKKTSGNYVGQWNKNELVPYGKASPEYREEHYLCPECDGELEPMQKEYRFVCPNCRLIFSWGFGGIYGFGIDSDKAEYLE